MQAPLAGKKAGTRTGTRTGKKAGKKTPVPQDGAALAQALPVEVAPELPAEPPPVLILASRESGGSFLAALLGAHPAFYGAPQLNLLAFEEVWQFVKYGAIPRDSNLHGILRFLGDRLMGEQSIQSVQAAQRWLARRAGDGTGQVHAELRRMVAPRRLVDYSPLVAQNATAMRRAVAALPGSATVIHLTRDPLIQGRAMCLPVWQSILTSLDFWDRRGRYQACMDVYEIGEQLIDWSVTPPVFDPQFAWHRTQAAAREVQGELPADRWLHLDIGALMADPATVLADLLTRLGVAADADTLQAMLGAGLPDYARPGPYQASFGMDFEMIDTSIDLALKRGRAASVSHDVTAPLPWRGDGESLLPEVGELAQDLGYDLGYALAK